eukprot:gene13320-biopygen8640
MTDEWQKGKERGGATSSRPPDPDPPMRLVTAAVTTAMVGQASFVLSIEASRIASGKEITVAGDDRPGWRTGDDLTGANGNGGVTRDSGDGGYHSPVYAMTNLIQEGNSRRRPPPARGRSSPDRQRGSRSTPPHRLLGGELPACFVCCKGEAGKSPMKDRLPSPRGMSGWTRAEAELLRDTLADLHERVTDDAPLLLRVLLRDTT